MTNGKPITRLCAVVLPALLLGGCSGCSDGNSASIRSVNPSYTLVEPEAAATGEMGQPVELEVFDVQGAMVELQ